MDAHAVDNKTLQALLAFQDELIACDPDLGTLMDLVARRAQDLTGAEGAVIELVEGHEIVYRATSGMAAGQLGLRISRVGSFSGLCVELRQTLSCPDTEKDARVNLAACRAVGMRSMVVQPLFHRENAIGVLKVMSSRPGLFPVTVDAVLALVSRTVAGVLANALRWNDLAHSASHDALTGIRNRSAFYDQLRQSLAMARRAGTRLGVALFDIDGLKQVNDTWGHQAGDVFIRTFAERLARRVRETDTVARLGGDEFGVLFSTVEDSAMALALGRQLAAHAEGPLSFGNIELDLKTSTGVSVYADDGPDLETLVAQADLRLYEDKRARRGL